MKRTLIILSLITSGCDRASGEDEQNAQTAAEAHLMALELRGKVIDLERRLEQEERMNRAFQELASKQLKELSEESVADDKRIQIGRASCRERVCQYV